MKKERSNKKTRPAGGTARRVEQENHQTSDNSHTKHTTNHGGGQAGTISGLLLCGAQNGLHLRDLCRLTGWTEREVRLHIHAERRNGVPILSDNVNGYFLPADEQELTACVRSLRGRAGEILAAAATIEEAARGESC